VSGELIFFVVLIATTDTGASPMPVATGDPLAGNTSCQTDAFATKYGPAVNCDSGIAGWARGDRFDRPFFSLF
jgi:hypothetical protein